jgi:hypothetical protein
MNDGVSYLRSLEQQIWTSTWVWQSYGRRRERVQTHSVTRPLTLEEWAEIKRIVKAESLGAVMTNSDYGFSLGLFIVKAPEYPDLPYEEIISLTRDHLPEELKKDWNAVWDTFSELTHDEANLSVLKFCKIDMKLNKGHYEY